MILITIPIRFSFEFDIFYSKIMNILLYQIPLIIFIFEILVGLNTSFYSKGNIIFDRKRITKNYFKNHFLLDLMTVGSQVASKDFAQYKYLQPFLFLQLFKVKNNNSKKNLFFYKLKY